MQRGTEGTPIQSTRRPDPFPEHRIDSALPTGASGSKVLDYFRRESDGRHYLRTSPLRTTARRTATFANFSGQPSHERCGASSGSRSGTVVGLFSFIGLPHADDSARLIPRSPDDRHHPAVQKNNRDEPLLAVVPSIFSQRQGRSLKNLTGRHHVQTPTSERFPGLLRVEDNVQNLRTITLLQKPATPSGRVVVGVLVVCTADPRVRPIPATIAQCCRQSSVPSPPLGIAPQGSATPRTQGVVLRSPRRNIAPPPACCPLHKDTDGASDEGRSHQFGARARAP